MSLARLAVSAVNISGCPLGGSGVGASLRLRPSLVRVAVRECNLNAAEVVELVQGLPRSVQELDLSDNALGCWGAARLSGSAPLLQLMVLLAENVGLRDAGLATLCTTLSASRELRHLSLARNDAGDRGHEALAQLLLRSEPCPPLRALDLSQSACVRELGTVREVLSAAEHVASLELLSLRGCGVDGELHEEAAADRACRASMRVLASRGPERAALAAAARARDQPAPCAFGCRSPLYLHRRELMARHYSEVCKERPQRCRFCTQWLLHGSLHEHLDLGCAARPFKCRHGCGAVWTRGQGASPGEPEVGSDGEQQEQQHEHVQQEQLQHQQQPGPCSPQDSHLRGLAFHEARRCARRTMRCPRGCAARLSARDMREHVAQPDLCPKSLVRCSGCYSECRELVAADAMEAHLRAHREAAQGKLIQRAEPVKAEPAENKFFRALLDDLMVMDEDLARQDDQHRADAEHKAKHDSSKGGGNASDKPERAASTSNERRGRQLPAAAPFVPPEPSLLLAEARAVRQAACALAAAGRRESLSAARAAAERWRATVPRRCYHKGCVVLVLDLAARAHQDQCTFRLVPCSLGCERADLRHRDVAAHVRDDCPMREVECGRDGCNRVKMPFRDLDMHNRRFHNPFSTTSSERANAST
jgi:hypothetical protein